MGGPLRAAERRRARPRQSRYGAWLFAHLAADRPLDKLPPGQCVKSVSFGSSTTIASNGETSPDLGCPGDARVAELNRTVGVIEKQLGITAQPRNRRYLE